MPDLSLNSLERSASRVRDQQGRRFLNYLPISYSTLVNSVLPNWIVAPKLSVGLAIKKSVVGIE